MSRRAVVYCNPDKPQAKRTFTALSAWLKRRKVSVIPRLNDPLCRQADFAVILGGDGTILAAARALAPHGVPILGVNLGRLGFLAATESKNLYSTVGKALQGRLAVEERLMLDVRVLGKGKKYILSCLALNDCYLHAGSASRITEVETSFNGEFLTTYKGDGVIVSTPTGSTAYSLAADGPIVSPDLGVLLVTPICPHTLSQRPLVISERGRLDLVVGPRSSPMLLSVDGQINGKVGPGTRVEVRAAERKLRLLVSPKRSYFEILRKKLGWGL
ncbi:MAG: hypothetical protein A3A86_02380 [Elusimicrobia bacterium RIFCSPLOWO2_01_FULL_60_11]|nr:MAG: hypothetical protein A3A86_02380 [Elusimicrobia bacterium RIFCSPLOWO2_01_FULL_60_11]